MGTWEVKWIIIFFSLLPEQHVRNPGGPHNFQLMGIALGDFYEES